MAKVSKTVVDKALRDFIFEEIMPKYPAGGREYVRINDRQYGVLLTDANGEQRYVRIGAIVAELREDMTAQELMESEIATYQAKQEAKAEKEKAKQEKIAKDKAERERKAKEQEEQSK